MQIKKFELPIFKSGKIVTYKGNIYTVDHVKVSGYKLKVKLKELQEEIDAIYIDCKPTTFMLK